MTIVFNKFLLSVHSKILKFNKFLKFNFKNDSIKCLNYSEGILALCTFEFS